MLERARMWILAMLRVPPEPHAPEGKPESTLIFRAGRNFYRWQVLAWAASHAGVVAGLIFALWFGERFISQLPFWWVEPLYWVGEALALAAFMAALPVTFLALRWQYELRWYIVTDRSLRIRRGVWNVEEITMTFANIQEIRVKSGPVDHLLGLAHVEVLSAGGGSTGPHGEMKSHRALFEGVDNASAIRDLMVERLRVYRDSGLGGDRATRTQGSAKTHAATPAAAAAARHVLDEVRALRQAIEPVPPQMG